MKTTGKFSVGAFGPVAALVCLLCASNVRGEVLFYAPFDGSLDAAISKGNGKGAFSPPPGRPEAKPVFVEGLRGKAIEIGSGCRVTYGARGNMNAQRGAIAFWAKRAGPKPEGRYTFQLGGWSNADKSWVMLYRWEWFDGVNMLHGKGGSGDIGLQLPGDGDDGQWHFFVFTWDGARRAATWTGRAAGEANGRTSPCRTPCPSG